MQLHFSTGVEGSGEGARGPSGPSTTPDSRCPVVLQVTRPRAPSNKAFAGALHPEVFDPLDDTPLALSVPLSQAVSGPTLGHFNANLKFSQALPHLEKGRHFIWFPTAAMDKYAAGGGHLLNDLRFQFHFHCS